MRVLLLVQKVVVSIRVEQMTWITELFRAVGFKELFIVKEKKNTYWTGRFIFVGHKLQNVLL